MKQKDSLQHKKVFLLTKQLERNPHGGREMLCKLNYDALRSQLGEELTLFELPNTRPANLWDIVNAFRGHIDGLNDRTIDDAISHIRRDVDQVFVDGSNFGGFVAVLKRTLPKVEVITFFHNVEARFFWGSLKTVRTPRALAVFITNFLAERKAARLSDKRICLSERDSRLLKKIYGKGATHIAPMALEDKLPMPIAESQKCNDEPFALFVGGSFYANRDGIAWFVRHVVPSIGIKVCIVGKGMEKMRTQLNIPGRVEVIGPVDSLAQWYRDAHFVIAPIFDGSGMKTKVAEALMFGKKIVGTPEAFSGYDDIAAKAGWICNSAAEFIRAIDLAQQQIMQPFDSTLREIYLSDYSLDAAKKRLLDILK